MNETEVQDILEITSNLGIHYKEWKSAEEEKNADKDRFYEYANSEILKGELAEKLVTTENAEGETDEMVIERVKRHNSGWLVDDWRKKSLETDCHLYEVILYEDETLKPYTYVNTQDGMVYARTVSFGSPELDDDYLHRADPDLYKEVTFELPWGEHVVKPLKSLEAALLARVKQYIYKGKATARLAAPRKAKPEELVDD